MLFKISKFDGVPIMSRLKEAHRSVSRSLRGQWRSEMNILKDNVYTVDPTDVQSKTGKIIRNRFTEISAVDKEMSKEIEWELLDCSKWATPSSVRSSDSEQFLNLGRLCRLRF